MNERAPRIQPVIERVVQPERMERLMQYADASLALEKLALRDPRLPMDREEAIDACGDALQTERDEAEFVDIFRYAERQRVNLNEMEADYEELHDIDCSDPAQSTLAGSYMFHNMTGKVPVGPVEFKRDIFAFALFIEDAEDMKLLYNDAKNSTPLGFFDRQGLKHHAEVSKVMRKVSIIAAYSTGNEVLDESTIAHERQHSFNHLVFGKRSGQFVSGLGLRPLDALHDEIVAQVRSGDGGSLSSTFFDSPVYRKSLIEPFHSTAKEQENLRSFLEKLSRECARYQEITNTQEGETNDQMARLAFMMARVPFEQLSTLAYSVNKEIRPKKLIRAVVGGSIAAK